MIKREVLVLSEILNRILTKTITLDQIPTEIASPALRTAKIPAVPAGTYASKI